jgi:hypothetical protein
MQNPKNKLEVGAMYKIPCTIYLGKKRTRSPNYPITKTVEAGSLVMFIEYHPGSVRTCKVMSGNVYGWFTIDSKYRDHTHFFQKVKP